MNKYIVVSLLIASNCFAQEEKKVDNGLFSGVYIAPVGVAKYNNLTDKPIFGVGLGVGFQLNPSVKLDATGIAFKKPDNWRGSAIDELDATAKFNLFSAAEKKLNLYGVAGVARDFNSDDWAIDIGAGINYNIYGSVDIFGQYVYQVWIKEKQSGLVTAGLSFRF